MMRNQAFILVVMVAISGCSGEVERWHPSTPAAAWMRGAPGGWGGSIGVTAETDASSAIRYFFGADLYSPEPAASSRLTVSLPLSVREPEFSSEGIGFAYEGTIPEFAYENAGTIVSFGPSGTAPENVDAVEDGWTSVDQANRPEETTGYVSSFKVVLAGDGAITGEVRWVWVADLGGPTPPVQSAELGGLAHRSCAFAREGFSTEWAPLSSPECAQLFASNP